MMRSLTNYLYRDINDWAKTFNTTNCTNSRCASHWDISEGAHGFDGGNVPTQGHTVVRVGSLLHIQLIIEGVLNNNIPGDIIEAGCFRGGAGVLMRAAVEEDNTRVVWIADSFQGIPMPTTEKGLEIDESKNWTPRYIVDQDYVQGVFRRYGYFPDPSVKFLPGFFNESLPTIDESARFSVIHIDADAYESVLDVLNNLYSKLSVGGYVIIDDIHLYGVRQAVLEFRRDHHIVSPILPVASDHTSTCASDFSEEVADRKHLDLVTPLSAAYWQKL